MILLLPELLPPILLPLRAALQSVLIGDMFHSLIKKELAVIVALFKD